MFDLKDKNLHPACKMYESTCPIQQITLAKQKQMLRLGGRNTRTQIKILNQLTKSDFPDHKFDWKILLTAHANTKLCKIWNHQ